MLRTSICASILAIAMATPAFAQDAPVDWQGPYVSAIAGYGGSTVKYPAQGTGGTGSGAVTVTGEARGTSSGVLGGGGIGYNFHTAGIVFGAEADIVATDVKAEIGLQGTVSGGATGSASGAINTHLDYVGTVRARAGVPIVDGRLMPYVTGGFAYGHVTTKASGTIGSLGSASWSKKDSLTGWTAGAGLEYSITPHVSFRTEYLYADLGKNTLVNQNFSIGGTPVSVLLEQKNTLNMVRASFSYRF